MNFGILLTSVRQIVRRPRFSLLAAMAFAVAILTYTVLSAIPQAIDRVTLAASSVNRLIVTAPNAYRLPARYCRTIQTIPHVLGCVPTLDWRAFNRDRMDEIVADGVTPDILALTGEDSVFPKGAVAQRSFTDRRAAWVGGALMREHGWQLGRPVTLRSSLNSHLSLTLVPSFVFPSGGSHAHAFFFDRRMLDDAIQHDFHMDIADAASFLLVGVDRPEYLSTVAQRIDRYFANSDAETETMTESDSVASEVSDINALRPTIAIVLTLLVATVLLITASTLAISVRERSREIGIMRALGFSRASVVAMLLAETTLIALSGSILGALLSIWFLGHGCKLVPSIGALGPVKTTWQGITKAVALGGATGFLSALAPATIAARIDPALAFRRVV